MGELNLHLELTTKGKEKRKNYIVDVSSKNILIINIKSVETKFKENIITTSTIEEMKDNYLAERLLRTWGEEFVDEDTGETIACTEIIDYKFSLEYLEEVKK